MAKAGLLIDSSRNHRGLSSTLYMHKEKRKARTYLTCQIDIRDKAMQRHSKSVWRMFEASTKVIVRDGPSETRMHISFPRCQMFRVWMSRMSCYSFPEDRVSG